MNFRILFLALVPLLTGCAESTPAAESGGMYFDNPKFIEETAIRLSSQHIALQKQLTTAGKSEQLQIPTPDWKKEFDLLVKTNLNAPAFKGLFRVDSIAVSEGYFIVYSALRDNMSIRKFVRTCASNGTTKAVQCLQQDNSLITQQTIEWRLVADSGYYYRGADQIKGVNNLSYAIGGAFKNQTK